MAGMTMKTTAAAAIANIPTPAFFGSGSNSTVPAPGVTDAPLGFTSLDTSETALRPKLMRSPTPGTSANLFSVSWVNDLAASGTGEPMGPALAAALVAAALILELQPAVRVGVAANLVTADIIIEDQPAVRVGVVASFVLVGAVASFVLVGAVAVLLKTFVEKTFVDIGEVIIPSWSLSPNKTPTCMVSPLLTNDFNFRPLTDEFPECIPFIGSIHVNPLPPNITLHPDMMQGAVNLPPSGQKAEFITQSV
jgi:hypothetical protein